MSKHFNYMVAILQEKQIMLEQINKVEEYQNKRKTRRLLIVIYGTIAIAMPVATLGLATVINLPCGVLATIGLSIPLLKAKKYVDKLKYELEKMEKEYTFITSLKRENCDKLRQRADDIFAEKLKYLKAQKKGTCDLDSGSQNFNHNVHNKIATPMNNFENAQQVLEEPQLTIRSEKTGHVKCIGTIPQRRG